MTQNSEVVLFITHVDTDGPLLKIWGQIDRNAATCIERMIMPLSEKFAKGFGQPTLQMQNLAPGVVCCARFQSDGYFRAKIVNVLQDGSVVVQFIDYGNVDVLTPADIRLLDGIPEAVALHSVPPQAIDFVLANVLPVNSIWEDETIESIRLTLRYVELKGIVHSVIGGHKLLKLCYNNQDFGELLVSKNVAIAVTLQDMFRPKYMQPPPLPRPTMQQKLPRDPREPSNAQNNYMTRKYPQNSYAQGATAQTTSIHDNWRSPPQQNNILQRTQQTSPVQPVSIPVALVFKSRVLDVGSTHDVYVSYVEDGPMKFSVQVMSTKEILSMLMAEINNHPTQPLQEPPLPGSVCLGRYTVEKVLCRAVVMSVMDNKCKLYYVDFGHNEVLPYTDIFQLPPQYINPKVLSIRFTLSGLKELNVTEEMKEYFKQIVQGKSLFLQVRPPEGPPLVQYGDLYDNGRNIKDILKENFETVAPVVFQSTHHLTRGVKEVANASFVESYGKFFVQLESGLESLNAVMACLAEYAQSAPALNLSQLRVGLPCCALYEVDQQWYRAQILSISGDKVNVLYVDYGNEETVAASALRKIHDDLVTKLRAQAIKCVLNGYQSYPFDQELANQFELLILEKRLTVVVVDVLPNGLLVDLYDPETTPMVNIRNQLQTAPAKNDNNSSNNERNDARVPNAKRSPPAKNQRSNVKTQQPSTTQHSRAKAKNTKMIRDDSWNQSNWSNGTDAVPEKSKTKSWQAEDGDKAKSKNWKQDENELRQRDNRFQRGDSDRFNGPRNERLNRDGPRSDRFGKSDSNDRFAKSDSNERFPKNESNDRYERNENGGFGRGNRETRGGRGAGPRNDNRFDKSNSSEKAWSDKDSDTSSRGSGKRSGRDGGRGKRGRGGGKDNGRGSGGRNQGGKWSDGDSDKGSFKGGRSNGDRNSGFKQRDKKLNDSWENDKPSKIGTWDSMSPSSSPRKTSTSQKSRIPPPNITVGAVKNCEVVFIGSPTDFYVQLSPDNLDLNAVMEKIAATYEHGGTVLTSSQVQPESNCIAQYADDLKWYRAVVKSNNRSNASVHFVDYGNTETTEFDKIKEIEPEFLNLPVQAVPCRLLAAAKTEWTAEEIDEFGAVTDGKTLEAEFVAQEEGVYQVLLREVVDNVPQTVYVNEKFSGGADLNQAKESAKNRGRNARSGRALPDYAPANQKWGEVAMSPESKEDVMVTWFINPNNFYCQRMGRQSDFRRMMNEIQKAYVGRQPVSDKLQVGTSVIAFFSDDGALYRAEIIEANNSDRYKVQYVDFGNCAMVHPRKIYQVERRFMELPKQAVHCTLRNVVPASGSSWSKTNANEIDKCFDADKYECTFHEIDETEGKHVISLINNGADVVETMVTKGLASYAVTTIPSLVTDTKGGDILGSDELERVDISLLCGQSVLVKISSVDSVTKFYMQLPSATVTQQAVTEYLINNDPKVMPRLSCREVCLGAGCLVCSEGVWRRAVVTDCSRTTGFDVRLIDTGAHDEISLDCILALPGQLSVMQNQAVECCLQNISASLQLDDKLKALVEDKDVIVNIREVDNYRLIVQLYDTLGNKIRILESETADSISPVCQMPIFSSTHKVWLTHVDHSGSVWLQRSVDTDKIATLLEALYNHYTTSGETLVPEPGKLCVAQGQDQNWYRAVITNVTDQGALVKFIDYGNSEDVEKTAIKTLEPQFYVPHALAIQVSLTVVLNGSEAEQQAVLREHLADKELTATFYNVNQNWVVELVEDGQKLSDKLTTLGLVKEVKKVQPMLADVPDMVVGGRYKVFLSHADSPAQFWLQRYEEIAVIDDMQANFQVSCPSYEPIVGVPEEGSLCAAVYSADNQWYRAEVLDADEDITTVRFVDYGNTDIIDNKSGNVRQLPHSWKTVKKYGIKCRLDVIPVGAEDWSEAACEKFTSLSATESTPIQALVIADSIPRRVELFVGDRSIGEVLVQEGHAVMVHNAEDLIDEIIDLELDPHSAFVSHTNSPSEFWVQEEKSVSDLEVMSDRFIVADMFPKLEEIKEGALCVAKFPEDDQWYRAKIMSHGDAGTEVIYIDYGNSAISTEIRTIPEDLGAIPALSRKCCLPLPPGVKQWSEPACEKFAELAADGATIFLLDVVTEAETSIVKLTLDGVSVADQLALLCDVELPVIEERLPPLGEENSPYVVVSHVNSPSEFWTQADSSIAELEVMADRMVEAQSFLPLNTFEAGTICAAKFPEDEQWYRAKILSHGESGTEVLYIDYGNSAVTTELRMLPEDIVNIASLSRCCALQLPEGTVSWSERANEKFIELVADGAEMFQFEMLDDEEPTHIRLLLEGEDVLDILSALCDKGIEVQPSVSEEGDEVAAKTNTEVVAMIGTTLQDSIESIVQFERGSGVNNFEETGVESVLETLQKSAEDSNVFGSNEADVQVTTSVQSEATEAAVMNTVVQDSKETIVQSSKDTGAEKSEESDVESAEKKTVLSSKEPEVEVQFTAMNDNEVDRSEGSSTEKLPESTIESSEQPDLKATKDKLPESAEASIVESSEQPDLKATKETGPELTKATEEDETAEDAPIELTKEIVVDITTKIVDVASEIPVVTEQCTTTERIDATQTDAQEVNGFLDESEREIEVVKELSIDDIVGIMMKTENEDNATKLLAENKIVPGSVSRGMSEEEIAFGLLERRSSIPLEEKIVPGSINKGNDLTEIIDLDSSSDDVVSKPVFAAQLVQESVSSPSKTQHADKIVPGSISRGESPSVELQRPATPKTPLSEKLVAGVVNLQECVPEYEDQDEVLTVEMENDIPKIVA